MLEFPGINEVLFCDAIKYQYLGSLALPSLLYWSNESVCIDRALIKCGSEYERVQFHSQLYQSARESQPVREEWLDRRVQELWHCGGSSKSLFTEGRKMHVLTLVENWVWKVRTLSKGIFHSLNYDLPSAYIWYKLSVSWRINSSIRSILHPSRVMAILV